MTALLWLAALGLLAALNVTSKRAGLELVAYLTQRWPRWFR